MQACYILHKPSRKNLKRNQTIVGGTDQELQADLAHIQTLSRKNKGAKYLLTVIDVFSNVFLLTYACAILVKNKGGPEMKNAFEPLFQMSIHPKPDKIQTKAGKEFINKDVKNIWSPKGSYTLFLTVKRKQQWLSHLTSHWKQKYGPISQPNTKISILINCEIL